MSAARTALWKPIPFAAIAAFGFATLGGTLTELGPWYRGLAKPDWQPPDWAFGPAWTIIFALAAISAALAWRYAPTKELREWVIGLFALNGFLNVLWSLLFFRLQRPDWALVEVVFLTASIAVLMVFVWRWSRLAAALLVVYLAWVIFASVLNWEIVRLNGSFG